MSDIAKDLMSRQKRMKSARANFERYWHYIAQLILPRADDFIVQRMQGQRRDQAIFDSTAVYALTSFAAALESLLTPRTQKWHNLRPLDDDLANDKTVKVYCEQVRDILFKVRYSPRANFASQLHEAYMGLGAFGCGCVFTEDGLSHGIRYMNVPLAEMFIQEDFQGVVDTCHRLHKKTARQAYQKWGEALPEAIKKVVEKEPDREFEFLHVVQPNEERQVASWTPRGMAFASFDISVEHQQELRVGGYRTKPYAFSRYVTANREVYGRSPGMDALADIRTLNEMAKTSLRYGQLVTDPPWLTYDVDSLSPFSVRPGSINAGYLNERGEPLAKALAPSGDPQFGLEIQNQKRESINRAFLVTLFQILVDTPEMTATEVMERAQEKGALLAPTMGRQQGELLDPIIERELDILSHAGVLPPMPDALKRKGGNVHIVYDSPLSRAQRADEGVGILRTIEALTPLAQVDQRVLKRFNYDRIAVRLAEVNGMPADTLYSDEEMVAIDQQQQQIDQLKLALQAAPMVAKSAKDFAAANQQAQQAPF